MEDETVKEIVKVLETYMVSRPSEEVLFECINEYLNSIRGHINEDEYRLWDISKGMAFVICSLFEVKYKPLGIADWD